jgi:hypothetical protein
LLEGPEIEPLLEQIREEYGPSARIVSADKVRNGGLGGFFTRQHYEVAVEVADDPRLDRKPAPPRVHATAGHPAGRDEPDAADSEESLAALLELVEESQDRFRRLPTTSDEPEASRQEVRSTSPIVRGNTVSTANNSFADFMLGLQGQVGEATESPAPPAPSASPASPAPSASPASPAPFEPATISRADGAARGRVIRPAGSNGPPTAALIEVGVPELLVREAASTDPYEAVREVMSTLPAPPVPPNRPGDVLVLVGEPAHALPVARQAAEMLGLDPSGIMLTDAATAGASLQQSGRVSGPVEARARARALHRADSPHVVVVDAPLQGDDEGLARATCYALGATAVWAVVDATRKTSETIRRVTAIGTVDALAVYHAGACADPASVLELGIPVALLDCVPATPEAWADLMAPLMSEYLP